MNDVPDNIVTIVAMVLLALIGALAIYRDFNHGILQLCIMVISALAGYKIKGIVDEETIRQLKTVTEPGKPQETADTA